MKKLNRILIITIVTSLAFAPAFAQDFNDLMKQGIGLHNAGKYDEAIAKYNQALKLVPDNASANYEIAFSLYSAKRPKEAITYLEKASKDNRMTVPADALLASIYDEDNQTDKAIATYQEAIKIDPAYPQIYYNMGIAYFRAKKYTEAESAAIEALKRAPKNPSNHRLYGLVTFHQNKRGNALLAFSNFLLLEPNTARSAETVTNMQSILKGGILKDDKGNASIAVSPGQDKNADALNLSISMSVLSAQSKNLTGTDLLENELSSIFSIAGQLAEKNISPDFFNQFYAAYLYKLVQSGNMPAFAHVVAAFINKDENAKWLAANRDKVTALVNWVQTTER